MESYFEHTLLISGWVYIIKYRNCCRHCSILLREKEDTNVKKLLSMLLALIMAAAMLSAAIAEEPAIVTIAFFHTEGLQDTWPSSNELKLLKEKYNIELDFQYYDTDQFALLMAGGNCRIS